MKILPILSALLLLLALSSPGAGPLPESKRADELLARGWTKAGAKPNPPASDEVIVRRLYLDIIGRIQTVLWGGGVRGGQTYGKTDRGIAITEEKVTIPDFNATIAHALGLPLETTVFAPNKRSFTVADKGKPITSIF